jgi:putative ABC transport system substrate-binding protein
VFVVGDDPVLAGLVASLARPGGNVTGVTFFGGRRLDAKRLELLHELAPSEAAVGVLVDPGSAGDGDGLAELEAVARALGRHLVIVRAGNAAELDTAFAAMPAANVGGLLVSGSPVFTSLRRELVALAARTSLPAIYDQRDHVLAGGLISYGASFTEAYRQAGVYAGRILRGEAPAHLPVLQPTRFELVVNLGTARALGLEVPPAILLRAEEVIE